MPNTQETYSLIQGGTINTTTSYTFTNIPQLYTDLKLIINARSTSASDELVLKFNGGNNWVSAWNRMNGFDGVSFTNAASASGSGPFVFGGVSFLSQTGFWGCADIYIANYTASGAKAIQGYGGNKSNNPGSQSMSYAGGAIASVGAITSIEVLSGSGANLASGSTFSLYGIIKY